MSDTLKKCLHPLHSNLPHIVRVPVPPTSITSALEAMHSWVRSIGSEQYAASPFRNYDDPWRPAGEFMWHFRSADAAARFATKFSGKLIERR